MTHGIALTKRPWHISSPGRPQLAEEARPGALGTAAQVLALSLHHREAHTPDAIAHPPFGPLSVQQFWGRRGQPRPQCTAWLLLGRAGVKRPGVEDKGQGQRQRCSIS